MLINIDYRFDTNGFFDDPIRKATLESAVQVWENLLHDDFPTVSAGIQFTIKNPQTGLSETIILDSDIHDLLIFVGSQSPPFGENGNAIGRGGPTGGDASGTIFFNRLHSSNFEPWVGQISFDPSPNFTNGQPTDWFFDTTLDTSDDLPVNSSDFFSTALHEIGHVLGFGTASSFQQQVSNGFFTGKNALNLNSSNPIPLESDFAHIQSDFSLNNESILLVSANQGRVFPSQVDLAILADIGYEIDGFTSVGETMPIAREAEDLIFGTILADEINGLGGNDTIQGDAGNDILEGGTGDDLLFGEKGNDRLFGNEGNDQVQGGDGDDLLSGDLGDDVLFGQSGRDRFLLTLTTGTDTINDFQVKNDLLQISPSLNLTNSDQLRAKITKNGSVIGGGLFSEITLSSENIVTLIHDQPLTEANFVFKTSDLPWNVNQNEKISPTDVIFLLNRLGSTSNPTADLNNDGIISQLDAIAVLSHFGETV